MTSTDSPSAERSQKEILEDTVPELIQGLEDAVETNNQSKAQIHYRLLMLLTPHIKKHLDNTSDKYLNDFMNIIQSAPANEIDFSQVQNPLSFRAQKAWQKVMPLERNNVPHHSHDIRRANENLLIDDNGKLKNLDLKEALSNSELAAAIPENNALNKFIKGSSLSLYSLQGDTMCTTLLTDSSMWASLPPATQFICDDTAMKMRTYSIGCDMLARPNYPNDDIIKALLQVNFTDDRTQLFDTQKQVLDALAVGAPWTQSSTNIMTFGQDNQMNLSISTKVTSQEIDLSKQVVDATVEFSQKNVPNAIQPLKTGFSSQVNANLRATTKQTSTPNDNENRNENEP